MAGILQNALNRLPSTQPTQPSHTLGWDFSGNAPQLVEQGTPQVPTYGNMPTQGGGILSEGRYTPIQLGPTPSGVDYSARHRTAPVAYDNDDGGVTNPSGASYASRDEFRDWINAGREHGYYGTIDDAINTVNTNPNSDAARATLTDFYNNAQGQPYAIQTPGLIGKVVDALGINDAGDVGQNIHNVGTTLDQSYTQPGSFDYMDTVTPSNAALDTLNTYTPERLTPEVIQAGTNDTPSAPVGGGYNPSHSDDNNDSDPGPGAQTGAETSHSGGYGGYADDTAVTDSGGSSGGGGGGTYCCTASVKQKVMNGRQLYYLHQWHHNQSKHWVNGYDVWGKWVAKNLVSKYKYFAELTLAFYEWKVNKKFTFKALQAAAIIYPGVFIAGFKKENDVCQKV